MYFDSLQAALYMEGHGAFVWAAYAITAVVLVLALVLPRRRAFSTLKRISGESRRAEAAQLSGGSP